jgi:F0F1-type ATP synthase assembly protein I
MRLRHILLSFLLGLLLGAVLGWMLYSVPHPTPIEVRP